MLAPLSRPQPAQSSAQPANNLPGNTLAPQPSPWQLRQALADLGGRFGVAVPPEPLPSPHHVATNRALARELGLDDAWLASEDALHQLCGNAQPPGVHTMASVYSGHQFGQWAGQLGDGRALLLGELDTPTGPQEIQIKGAGLTPFSRMGDGRAVLRSSVREFLCSEAMHGLGLPTTRALYLAGSPQKVRREVAETAAVVTRVAPSFLRFGHFEHFSFSNQHEPLRHLADHVLRRFYPDCQTSAPAAVADNPYAALLYAVGQRTAALLAGWQAVGFCHGVMNTDNMSILGLTLDYGPFQFMDGFDPAHVCNHSDTAGRYAYNQQPQIAYWNLFCLGQALLPLIGEPDTALAALEPYRDAFASQLTARMAAKLGLPATHPGAGVLVDTTLALLASQRVDYTLFWHRLTQSVGHARAGAQGESAATGPLSAHQTSRDLFPDRYAFDTWEHQYSEQTSDYSLAVKHDLMLKNNPKFVLRNYLAQTAIDHAEQGDFRMVNDLLQVLQHPFDAHPAHEAWAGLPPDWAAHIAVSCSS